MPANILQKNITASGVFLPPTVSVAVIQGFSADAAGTVVLTDGLGVERLRLVLGSPTVVMFPGNGIACQKGCTVTLTGVTNLGLFYTA